MSTVVVPVRCARHDVHAIDVEAHHVGICAAASALVGPTGVLQAVAVVVPTHRFHVKAPRIIAGLRSLNPAIDEEAALRGVEAYALP